MRDVTLYNSTEKIWSAPYMPPVFNTESSVGVILQYMMKIHTDRTAIILETTEETMTFNELNELSTRVAQNLQKLNLTQEDIIGICSSNSLYLTPLALGAFLTATPISTLDPSFDKEGIKHIYNITKPKIMFCDGNILGTMREALKEIGLDCPIFTMDNHSDDNPTIDEFLVQTNTSDFIVPELLFGSDQTVAILCSSGSTGLPKGVTISHKSMLNALHISNNPMDVVLVFSTLYWLSGFMGLILGTVNGSTRILTTRPFNADLMLDLIEKYRVSFIIGPPSQMAQAIQSPKIETADLSSISEYFCGGSSVPFSVVQKMKKYIPNGKILTGYGMTELSGACNMGEPKKPNANGHMQGNFQTKILDDEGNKLGIGATGEIVIKPRSKWNGYYRNKDATDEIYRDGWIYSGDLGYFDEEGVIYLVDRKKDILKYKNFHYFPSEIEQVIAQIPDVIEVCVCGIPDPIVTDLPSAAIIKRKGSSLTEDDVFSYVAERMAHFKHLYGGVYFVDDLPKTASGKNIRRSVKGILEKLHTSRDHHQKQI